VLECRQQCVRREDAMASKESTATRKNVFYDNYNNSGAGI